MEKNIGAVAQLGEHLLCTQRVGGSSPLSSTRWRRIMLEIIGLFTCIYLGIKIFPSVVKFTVKVAVAILFIIFLMMIFLN